MKKIKKNSGENRGAVKFAFLAPLIIIAAAAAALRIFFCTGTVYAKAKTPASPEAAVMYKKTLKDYGTGNLSGAYEAIKFLLDNYRAEKTLYSDIYYLYGRILYKCGDFFSAKPYFQRVIYKNPGYKQIYGVIFYMARCDFNLKNYRRSVRDFNFLIKKTGKGSKIHDESLVYLTLSYASSGKTEEADKLYETDGVKKILKKLPFLEKKNNYFKLVYMDYLINHKVDLSDALLILGDKNLFSPDKKESCYKSYYEGLIALKEKNYPVAQNYFVKSSKYCSGYYYKSGLVYYGIASVKLKNYPDGIKYVKSGLSAMDYPGIKLTSLKFLAGFYDKENKPETELKYIKRILFGFPYMPEKEKKAVEKNAAELIYGIIKNAYKNNRPEEALKALKRIIFLIPEKYMKPKTYFYISKIMLKEKKRKGAVSFAEKYNSLTGSPASAFYLSDTYYKLENYKKSLSFINGVNLKTVKNIKLRNKIIYLKLQLYKKLNLAGDYINLLKKNIDLLPPEDKIKNLYFLGQLEFNENNLKTANAYFGLIPKNAYAKEKDNKNILYGAYYYTGLINYALKNYKTSLLYFKKSYALDPSGAHFQYELSQIAYIYMKYMNNKKLALKYYALLEKNAASSTYKSLASSMISAINMRK